MSDNGGNRSMPLADLLVNYRPGSSDGPSWSWDDEEADILARICICCGEPGHYQRQLEAHMRERGLTEGICLGDDGRVWDGHHRIITARRLGIEAVPLESSEEAGERWLRDHGHVDWHGRKTGDRSPWEHEWRERAARGDFGPDEKRRLGPAQSGRCVEGDPTQCDHSSTGGKCDVCGAAQRVHPGRQGSAKLPSNSDHPGRIPTPGEAGS